MRIQEILDQLNALPASDPYPTDLIHGLPEWDQDATNRAAGYGYGASFGLADGTLVVFDGQLERWVVMDPETGVAVQS